MTTTIRTVALAAPRMSLMSRPIVGSVGFWLADVET